MIFNNFGILCKTTYFNQIQWLKITSSIRSVRQVTYVYHFIGNFWWAATAYPSFTPEFKTCFFRDLCCHICYCFRPVVGFMFGHGAIFFYVTNYCWRPHLYIHKDNWVFFLWKLFKYYTHREMKKNHVKQK